MRMQDTPAVKSYRLNIGQIFLTTLAHCLEMTSATFACIQTLQGTICVEIQFFAYSILCKLFYAGIPS